MKKQLLVLHRWLLPNGEKMQFSPYIWLVYLGIFFVSAYYSKPNSLQQVYIGAITLFFLVVYFHAYRTPAHLIWIHIVLLLGIATWGAAVTPGASVFFVYAGAFCCHLGSAKKAFLMLLGIAVYIGVLSFLNNYPGYFYIPASMFTLMIGGVNIYHFEIDKKRQQIELSEQELKALATTAERERIARDLHDTMGHTFSVLTRKAELASSLFDHDVSHAKQQVQDIETISRDTLKQIRDVVTGYRTGNIQSELAHAKYVLETNNIQFNYQFEPCDIGDTANKEIALIIKELVTNVLKHAQANQVNAQLQPWENGLVLVFKDDGTGHNMAKPNGKSFGLTGIQERVNGLNGHMTMANGEADCEWSGFFVEIKVPYND